MERTRTVGKQKRSHMLSLSETRTYDQRLQTASQQQQWQPRQSTSQGCQAETNEYEQVAHVVTDNRNPQQKVDDWLKNIANEDDETKDAIMQMLWKQEDFPNA
jgi:hypothetical protein